jgi:hypothetical protein
MSWAFTICMHQIALRSERAAVEAEGVAWKAYNDFTQEHTKEIGDERLQNVPTIWISFPLEMKRTFRRSSG